MDTCKRLLKMDRPHITSSVKRSLVSKIIRCKRHYACLLLTIPALYSEHMHGICDFLATLVPVCSVGTPQSVLEDGVFAGALARVSAPDTT